MSRYRYDAIGSDWYAKLRYRLYRPVSISIFKQILILGILQIFILYKNIKFFSYVFNVIIV